MPKWRITDVKLVQKRECFDDGVNLLFVCIRDVQRLYLSVASKDIHGFDVLGMYQYIFVARDLAISHEDFLDDDSPHSILLRCFPKLSRVIDKVCSVCKSSHLNIIIRGCQAPQSHSG